ncbi:MAG TPA: sigma 54-interacting transcriptional regulator [Nitrospira sp.]|nr:sigma 54-interacting transcriptional regulator [Nitrospira sp.]
MLDRPKLWRLFITSIPLQAPAIGLLAALFAQALWAVAPATFTALEWTAYDTWLRHRAPIAVSPLLTIVAQDPAGEERFGPVVDRSLLAQIITAAHEAGAAAIGVDHRLDHASPAQLGGAASDALLVEAIHNAGPVVFVHDPDQTLRSDAAILGHLTVSTSPDHVTREIPLLATAEARTVPAFGSLLYDLSRQQASPAAQPLVTDRAKPMLLNVAGNGSLASLPTISLASVWDAIQHHDNRKLDEWFKGQTVVILPNPISQGPWLLPTGQSVSGVVAHLQLLNSLLTDNRICAVGALGRSGITVLLASLVAWCLLRLRGSTGLLFAGSAVTIYGGLMIALMAGLHLLLPSALPLTAAFFVLIGAASWTHLTAGQRLILLERDMLRLQNDAAAVREALILRESRAEALQEDLEAAKAAVAQSAGRQEELTRTTESLRSHIAEAQAQEQAARLQLERLERQLHDLRAAGTDSPTVGDSELDQLRTECRQLGIITQDPALLRLFRDVKKGARSPLTVLLLGEPGTGKELFARAVHRLSARSGKTFVAVNMAAISPELFESELFGHTKGSFTGATVDRRGYFELAGQGTIFLDEIGDLRLDHQSKLLRVLQEKSFYRVGATTPTTVDVRIVAATNRDLQRGVSEGWFREDLYFRLKGLVFRLPPLRERPGDIPIIAEACLAEIARQMGRPVPKLSNDALRMLSEYDWPGNVRELRHALERAFTLSDGPVLMKNSFYLEGVPTGEVKGRTTTAALPDSAGDAAVLNCLRQHGFDMQATAKTLAWDRSTVTQRLKGLCFQALVESNGDIAKAALSIAGDPSHLRTVELKLKDYYSHLSSVIEPFTSADEALLNCRRRFKNLPDRHFASVEALVRQQFRQKTAPAAAKPTALRLAD